MASASNPARRRRRGWWVMGLLVLILVGAAVAALPWALSTPPGRRRILAGANRVLAPGGLQFESLRLSWFAPTEIGGFTFVDPQGDRVLVAPHATWDRNLWQILFDRPRYGTLTLNRAAIDVERDRDGSIDLVRAIRPLFRRDPRTDVTIRVANGSLRFRSPELAEPVRADRAGLTIHIASSPRPLTWQLDLANGQAESLAVQGRFDRWKGPADAPHDLAVDISGRRWPLALDLAGLQARGRWDGQAAMRRADGRWGLSGSSALLDLDATAPVLAGDHLRLDRVGGTWDVAETAEGWAVRRLDLTSPVGSLKAEGALPARPGASTRIEGQVDLAALARQLPHALRLHEDLTLDRGSAHVHIKARQQEGQQTWEVAADVSDLVARKAERVVTLHEPATLSALLVRQPEHLRVDRLGVKTAFLDASARGDLDRGVELTGSIDLGGLQKQLHDLVDFGSLDLAGKGPISGRYQRTGPGFEGSLSLDLHDLRAAGLVPGLIERDVVRIEAKSTGRADEVGLPRSWDEARLTLASGDLTAELRASAEANATRVIASTALPVSLSGQDGKAEGRVSARRAEGAHSWAIDEAQLRLVPAEPGQADSPPIALALRGQYDPAKGELVLEPAQGAGSKVIALAPEGVRVSGLGRGGDALRAEGGLTGDLAALAEALAAWGGPSRTGLAGSWALQWSATDRSEGLDLGARLDLRDLARRDADGQSRWAVGPVSLTLRALRPGDEDRLDLAECVLTSPYATVDASGRLTGLDGPRELDLKGTLAPDWKAINDVLARRVEPQAHIEGKPRALSIKGPLRGDSLAEVVKGLEGELGFDLVSADCFGMRVGPTPVVVRPADDGSLAFRPIRTTLNNGRLHVDPKVTFDDQGATLRLAAGSTIDNAEVNAEVSRQVLAFVAPILQEATRVSGLVSAQIDRAEIPLVADAGREAVVEGNIAFHNVVFSPGPLADQLIGLVGAENAPTLKLDQPVLLSIEEGRVIQRGLAVPIGRLTRVELAGAVDFDRNLDLVASLPVTPQMVGNLPVLADIVGGTRINVPIRGTLANPRIDREALNADLKNTLKNLGARGAAVGLSELLTRMTRPRDPDAPPPLTREERRQRRMERKAERQREREMRRGGP